MLRRTLSPSLLCENRTWGVVTHAQERSLSFSPALWEQALGVHSLHTLRGNTWYMLIWYIVHLDLSFRLFLLSFVGTGLGGGDSDSSHVQEHCLSPAVWEQGLAEAGTLHKLRSPLNICSEVLSPPLQLFGNRTWGAVILHMLKSTLGICSGILLSNFVGTGFGRSMCSGALLVHVQEHSFSSSSALWEQGLEGAVSLHMLRNTLQLCEAESECLAQSHVSHGQGRV